MNWKDKEFIRRSLFVFLLVIMLLKMDWIFQFVLRISSSFHTLVIGAVMAYIVNIAYVYFEKKGIRKKWALVLAYMVIFFVIAAILLVIIPEFSNSIRMLIENLPDAIESLGDNEYLKKYAPMVVQHIQKVNWQSYMDTIVNFVKTNVLNLANGTLSFVNSFMNVVSDLLIAFIFSIYLLSSKEELKQGTSKVLYHFLKPSWLKRLQHTYQLLHHNFYNFIVGQVLEAFILSSLCALGMFIFHFPYALSVGILVGFINIIPIIGAYMGGAIGVFMVLTVKPILALFFLLYLCILQQIESNLIYPKVVGGRIGLPAIWVFATVVVMGSLFGVLGMLVGIPLAATVYQMLQEALKKKDALETSISHPE